MEGLASLLSGVILGFVAAALVLQKPRPKKESRPILFLPQPTEQVRPQDRKKGLYLIKGDKE